MSAAGRSPESVRVASLLPCATEIVCALGLRERLVGISHECDHPREVAGLPALTRAKVFGSQTSRAIHRDVLALVRDALGVYDIDVETLKRVRPDVIVTQDLCDVCAVSYADVCAAARKLANPALEIVNLRPTRLANVWADVRTVARALGVTEAGERVAGGLEARVAAIAERAAAAARSVGRPRVLTIEWIDPVMIGGTWMPELVELAGGEALVTRPGDHAPTLALDALRALAPEVVLVKPCGYDLAKSRRERDTLRALFGALDWPATRARRMWIADGNAYFNRPGPRLVESLEILAACVHPAAFPDFAARHAEACVTLELL